jgi:hypothetical protein
LGQVSLNVSEDVTSFGATRVDRRESRIGGFKPWHSEVNDFEMLLWFRVVIPGVVEVIAMVGGILSADAIEVLSKFGVVDVAVLRLNRGCARSLAGGLEILERREVEISGRFFFDGAGSWIEFKSCENIRGRLKLGDSSSVEGVDDLFKFLCSNSR